jgi:hypothetical protein
MTACWSKSCAPGTAATSTAGSRGAERTALGRGPVRSVHYQTSVFTGQGRFSLKSILVESRQFASSSPPPTQCDRRSVTAPACCGALFTFEPDVHHLLGLSAGVDLNEVSGHVQLRRGCSDVPPRCDLSSVCWSRPALRVIQARSSGSSAGI